MTTEKITVSFQKDVITRLREIQGKLIVSTKNSVSLSEVVDTYLRKGLELN